MLIMSFLAVMMVLKFLETPTRICALIILTTNLIMLLVIGIILTILTYILIGTYRSTLIGAMLITHKARLMANAIDMII